MIVGAVDIGGTKVAVGMVDENGRVLAHVDFPSDPDNYAGALQGIIAGLRETSRSADVAISGIGIGSTGPLDAFTGQYGLVDFLPGWRDQNLPQDLARVFGVSAAMENDGDAAVLGESGWGAGKNKPNIIYVTVGTGIGGGIFLNGRLYRGVEGAHPEIGHQVIASEGPVCSCGFRGCWESLAAGPGLALWARAHAPADYPDREKLTTKLICQLARQGMAWAREVVDREARLLGVGIANLISLFTPNAIVLGGSVMKSADLLMDGIRREIASGCKFVPADKTEILLASLGEHANLIGAARVWHFRCGEAAAT